MAIVKRSSFAAVFAALLSASAVSGQTNISFDRCELTSDARGTTSESSFGTGRSGSARRTYGNLCAGTTAASDTTADTNVDSRIGHDFRVLCDLIDEHENVKALMATGNSPHTVFAPTDAAFAKVDGILGRIDGQRLLELHILPQARLTRDLRCGQTYRTVNTNQNQRDRQRSKTRCVSAARSQQLGPGNMVNGLKPTIGVPNNIFRRTEFASQDDFVLNVNEDEATAADQETFSENVISCNGVIHVVDEVLLPGAQNAFLTTPYYGSKPNYYGGYSHSHGYYGSPYYHGQGHVYGYGRGYHKHGKKSKKNKGYKGGVPALPLAASPYYYGAGQYYQPPFRKLEGGDDADAYEMPMSDAEFFGTDEFEASGESSEENRKRRLEAMLEPDGNIKV